MSTISTHVLDTAAGRPARGVEVRLYRRRGEEEWTEVFRGETDGDGRADDLLEGAPIEAGIYRVRFEVEVYYEERGRETFYPRAEVVFRVDEPGEHYHVPLLLSPWGYTTYRGS